VGEQSQGGDSVVEQLRAMIRASGQSLNQLSKSCGVGRDRLSRFVRGERGISLEAADRVCQALHLRLVQEPNEEKVRGRK
jgi:transcriptional regulator with XRE-family HTH domain